MAGKVHPDAAVPELAEAHVPRVGEAPATVLTVWRKSLLFNCDGFTVFDASGDLAFRVDCYDSIRRRAEVVLMNATGRPLLTIRRKRLSLAEHWVIYDGDGDARPLLSVRRHVGLRSSSFKALAHVTPLSSAPGTSGAEAYVVEGSYAQRTFAVRDARGDAVAEARRKESVGDEVFWLVVLDPRLGAHLAVGLVIALDEMFGGPGDGAPARSLLPRSWSWSA